MNNMKILFISLGCDKNLVDSEHMLGLLVEHGFEITDSEEDAEVIVINTCCFIHDAKEESIQNILEMAKYRTAGSCNSRSRNACKCSAVTVFNLRSAIGCFLIQRIAPR